MQEKNSGGIRMIKKVFVVHHTHTDIGYTDIQTKVIEDLKGLMSSFKGLRKEEWKLQDFI